jgi:hypothetical protein
VLEVLVERAVAKHPSASTNVLSASAEFAMPIGT